VLINCLLDHTLVNRSPRVTVWVKGLKYQGEPSMPFGERTGNCHFHGHIFYVARNPRPTLTLPQSSVMPAFEIYVHLTDRVPAVITERPGKG
jgi:hypothetical protein